MRFWRWLIGPLLLLYGRRARRRAEREDAERIVPRGTPERSAETLVLILLGLACLFAVGFVVVYALFSPSSIPNELLGICLAGSLASIAAALAVVGRRLVVTEELEEDYPPEDHPEEQEEVTAIVRESGSRITRKRLLLGAGTAAAGTLGLAALTPALSIGPIWYTDPLMRSPWRRGLRLVDEHEVPYSSSDIERESFYTAFPENRHKEDPGASLVVVRVDPSALQLPASRIDWAPSGILAFSKICTHAGCAVALYRKPTFPELEPHPALVCPCHYSTFDPARGGSVIYGPAGRGLPQLPLMVDGAGYLRAAGNFSGPVGPSWWGVRRGRAK
jgi:ubiquinol-cytochrome c reductase iron-sulfur subunit